MVILVSLHMSQVWHVNPIDLSFFVYFLIDFFSSLIIKHLVDYELCLVICFSLFSIKLS